MKLWKIMTITLAATLSLVGSLFLAAYVYTCSNQVKLESKILTAEEVNLNFKEDGIWHNKTIITANDLSQYESIDNNAFDNVTLSSIELPGDIDINFIDIPMIIWSGIDEIKIKESSNDNFWVYSNVLYYKPLIHFVAITITKRNETIEINFPTVENDSNMSEGIKIPRGFYKNISFRNNISRINFHDENNPGFISKVYTIDDGAFENCEVLNPNLSININKFGLWIWTSAFEGSNVEKISIVKKEDYIFAPVFISINSFANCSNLNNISIDCQGLALADNCFANCGTNLNLFIRANVIIFGSNILKNDQLYNEINISISLIYFSDLPEESLIITNETFSSIKTNSIDNFNFMLIGVQKEILQNSGLTNEQYNKIENIYG